MKTQTLPKGSIQKMLDDELRLKDATLGKITLHLAKRFKFELVLLYAVTSSTWYIVNYWAVAWQHFVK